MNSIMWNIGVGLLSACGMLVFFLALQRFNLATFNVVSALGSFLRQKEEGAYWVGAVLIFLFGAFFGPLYGLAFKFVPIPSSITDLHLIFVILGMGLGFNHGMLCAIVIAVFFTRFHPLSRYREVGFLTAMYFAFANIFYGALIGFFYH